MSYVQKYLRAAVYILMFCMPPAWARFLSMQVARVRIALGPGHDWPAAAVRSSIPDLKAAWRSRMLVWAEERWQLVSGPRLGAGAVCRRMEIVGIEHLHEAVRSGDGAIVLLAHQVGMNCVGWALMGAQLPWSGLVDNPGARLKGVARWWNRTRLHVRAFGASTLLRPDASGIRQAYKRLRNGELVCMPQDLHGGRYRVNLLRGTVSLALGSVRMAMAMGARIIPCAVVAAENGIQVCFLSPIAAPGGEQHLAEAVARALESVILSAPELWWQFVLPETEGSSA